MPALFTLPKQVVVDSSGNPLAGALVYFYATGTSTPQNTYQDESLTTPHANPVVASAAGVLPVIYLNPASPSYRVRVATSADVQLYQVDNIPSNQSAARSLRLEHTAPEIIFDETDASSGNQKWRARVNAEAMTIDLGNDAESVWANVLTVERTGNTLDSVTIGGNEVATEGTGTFTGTLTGFGSNPSGTVSWSRTGNHVTLFCESSITGTSNATSMTMTGLPSALQPTNRKVVPCYGMSDNAGTLTGWADISGSIITFLVANVSGSLVLASNAGFTNSGTKGLVGADSLGRPWTVQYDLT